MSFEIPPEAALDGAIREKEISFFAGCALSGLIAGTMSLTGAVTEGETQGMNIDIDWDGLCEKAYQVAHLMMEKGNPEE